jgi:peptidoglycan hydrolase-like protein with peptidoglycan-binding domain
LSLSFRPYVLGVLLTLASAMSVVSVAEAQTAASTAGQLGSRTLKVGATGGDVVALQELLVRTGFRTATDGQYGDGTRTAVARFQRAARLTVTGNANGPTIARLKLAANGRASINNGGYDVRGATRSKSLGDRIPLRRGMSGHDVKVLQDYLRRSGFRTSVDGQFGRGTRRVVKAFEASQELTTDGVVDANDIAQLRSLVEGDHTPAPAQPTAPAPLQPGQTATVGPDGLAIAPADAPDQVKAIIAAGNAIATKPYIYGGGHGKWDDAGYDCSGSVSYALHGAGLLEQALPSGSFMSWGEPGAGQWVTIYAHGSHMYMVVAGLRFDTSGRSKTGSRWQSDMRSPAGYTVVHPPGL